MTHVGAQQPSSDAELLHLARTAGCTTRQLEVLTLMARGYGAARIARILDISPQAVTARRDGAYRRIRKQMNGTAS